MSFSFQLREASKADILNKAGEELDKVIANQQVHAADKPLVLAVVEAYLGLLAEDDTKDVAASVNGSLSWQHGEDETKYVAASVGVNVYYLSRDAK